MIAAADWSKTLPNAHRAMIPNAVRDAENDGKPEDLQEALDKLLAEGSGNVAFTIPASMRAQLDRYAEQFGYTTAEGVMPMIIAHTLKEAGIE